MEADSEYRPPSDGCSLCEVVRALPETVTLASDQEWITYIHPSLPHPNAIWLQTRDHRDGVWDITDSQATSMGWTIRRAARVLRRARRVGRVYAVGFGENHQHMHLLMIGRKEKDEEGALRGPDLVADVLAGYGMPEVDRAAEVAESFRPYFWEQEASGKE